MIFETKCRVKSNKKGITACHKLLQKLGFSSLKYHKVPEVDRLKILALQSETAVLLSGLYGEEKVEGTVVLEDVVAC